MSIKPHQSRFFIKSTFIDDNKTFGQTLVEIFDKNQNDNKIGEYIRNYKSNPEHTFFPFKNERGEWYALYSENYDRTYIMSLPDCKKIGECNTDRPNSTFDTSGFCPLRYWVPCVAQKKYDSGRVLWYDPESSGKLCEQYDKIDWHHADFGFVFGCYWSGPYYIQLIDLINPMSEKIIISDVFRPSEVPEKIRDFSQIISIEFDHSTSEIYGVSVNGICYDIERKNNKIVVIND